MIIGLSGKKQSGKDTVASIIQYLVEYPNSSNRTDGDNRSYNSFVMDMGMGYDAKWKTKKFADKLKNIVCLLIGCTREQLEDNKFKERELGEEWNCMYLFHTDGGIITEKIGRLITIDYWKTLGLYEQSFYRERRTTPRLLLQLLGTECGRQIIHPNIWVNALMSEYKPNVTFKGVMIDFSKDEDSVIDTGWRAEDKSSYPNWIITDLRFPNEAKAIKDRGGILTRINRTNWVETIDNEDGTKTLTANPQFNKIDLHESETALDDYKEFDWIIENNTDIQGLVSEVKSMLIHFKII